MSLLILKSRPLVVIPELAVRLGLNEAILLQQIQYWMTETTSGVEFDNVRWIYNTYEDWQVQVPFMSISTIKRAFSNLKALGVLRIEKINKHNHDRTNYYSINYEHSVLHEQVKMTSSNSQKQDIRTGQNDLIDKRKMKPSISSNCPPLNGSKWPVLTETTTEITSESSTETKTSCQVLAEPDHSLEKQVLDYFNKITDSNYQEGKSTMGYLRGRLAEGYSPDDLILVVDYVTAKWAKDGKMQDYLRPKTVFGPENCIEYLEKAQKWHAAGRPACVNGRWLKAGEVPVVIDTVERDSTFRQMYSTGWEPKNQVQALASKMAKKAGLGRMSEVMGLAAWRGFWKQAVEQVAKEQGAA